MADWIDMRASSRMAAGDGNRTYASELQVSRGGAPMDRANRGFKTIAIALLSGLLGSAHAEIKLTTAGDVLPAPQTSYVTIQACNETNSPQQMEGWKFRTKDFAGYNQGWMGGFSKAGTAPVEYTQKVPAAERQMQAGTCRSAATDYSGAVPAGQNGTLIDLQSLIKTGSCTELPPYKDAAPAGCTDIEALTGAATYYGNQCLIDSIGSNGGDNYGGFVSTFYGQSQIQAAIPPSAITISGTSVKWNPYVMGPQYMMALAMGQEIMNVDMQFLTAIGGKETGAGMVDQGNGKIRSEDGSYTDNGTFGYWQVEDASFATYMKAYPQFFPKYGPCLSKYPDVTSALTAGNCATSWSAAEAFYLQPTGANKMGPNTPQIANGVLTSTLAWYGLYDALAQSPDLCFVDAIKNGKDKRTALAALIVGYNVGRYSTFGEPFKDPKLKDNANASALFDPGHNNYRPEIYSILDLFINASKNCGSRNIYDTTLTLREVQRFLFGGSATPGTAEAQGDGGLLLHYPLDLAARQETWADVTCAFDKLKGKAPSTTGKADVISYRYDWLTILRVVKKHLPFQIMDRKVPVENDFQYVVDKFSRNPQTCSGKLRDETYPSLTVTSPPPGSTVAPVIAPGLKVAFTGTDNVAVAKADWSMDKNWLSWNPAAKTTGNGFEFYVSCELPGYPKKGQKLTMWIRTTDDCGNSTVQQVDYTAHSTANCGDPPVPPQVAVPSATPPGREFSALTPGVNVTLSVATPGAAILYTTDGTEPDSVVGGATRQYADPLAITATTVLKARGVAADMSASAVMTETYTKVEPGKVAKPAANPPGRNFTATLPVTLTDATPAALIFYTLDGSVPDTVERGSTKQLKGPIVLAADATLSAIAVKAGMYASDIMTEKYTMVPPIAVKSAWYLDGNGDGRIDQAVVVFSGNLAVAPDKLAFTILAEDGRTLVRTAGGAEIKLDAGSPARAIVTFADPFPVGVTSLKNAATSGQTFRQDAIPLIDGTFAVADSAAPVIMKAMIEEGDSTEGYSKVTLTYSEPVMAPPAGQTAWIFKRKDTEMASAEVHLISATAQGESAVLLLVDTASTLFPIIGDSVAINTLTMEIKDKNGLAPKAKLFRILEGTPPQAKPIKFTILNPNGSTDHPSAGPGSSNASDLFIPLGKDGGALAGDRQEGRCQGCVAVENGNFVGPVFDIVMPGPLTYQFRVFTNTGEFVAETKGRIEAKDLESLKKDRAGKNYELPVVWTGKSKNGLKAGTGAYIVMATFLVDTDPRTGALAYKSTDKKIFGLIRKL